MRIILFKAFGLEIKSYGLMIAIGILVAASLLLKEGKEKGYEEDSLLNLIILTVIGGVVGGKLLFIITEFKSILEDPSILLNFGYGFVVYGALILGALTIYLYCKKKKWKVLEILDLVAPVLAIAQGFGRIGCFLAGCCYGKETNIPIGVEFPINSLAPAGIHVHPTQIYSSIFDFLLGFFLLYYSKKEKKSGKIVSMYLIIYSIGRFMVEFFRNDPRGNVGLLSTSQFIAVFTLILGLVIFNFHNFFKGAKK
ncbi:MULTISPECIES: prolipoprotein diacylglyceryl transferase [unclassified Clostridium]|uniref:prolipoprotein diacylglyceryl transferase n=1 Tax=unclassified Clostridium TaxID=2614128 RepID=UPI0013F89407|nr:MULTISPECIES: prolipoprotein diacylglyceryl transferase [unclassified Clostridium]NFR85513.1 prolipoprotein diacylglyceryl transferase [Clostridium botulinum]NFR90145.1 prolipoprotein diacylglyceryl transferase [Clostridium botulinum]NFT98148.1 prolipoprotein diacylglyceryl transferase [Clostridium botulinum]